MRALSVPQELFLQKIEKTTQNNKFGVNLNCHSVQTVYDKRLWSFSKLRLIDCYNVQSIYIIQDVMRILQHWL